MGSFADIGLTYIFAVALAGLIVLTLVAAFARLFWKNRQLAQDQKKQDLEEAEKVTQNAAMQETVLGEGDYFGVRAIERGYYGGVAQSPLASPGNSPRPSPAPTIRDSNVPSIPLITGPSIPELVLPGHRVSCAPSHAPSMKMPTSPISLRLHPSDAELSGRRNHDSTTVRSTYASKSLSIPEAPADERIASKNVSRAPPSPNTRPILHRRVQSYAQWRLAADMKQTPRNVPKLEVTPPYLTSQNGLRSTSHTQQPTGRPRSHSASMVGGTNQLSSLQQEQDGKMPTDPLDVATQPAAAVCKESTGRTKQSARDHVPSQRSEYRENYNSTDATLSSRPNRSTLPRIKKGVTKSLAQDRRSRKTSKTNSGSSIHHSSDSGCELEIEISPPNAGKKYSERARSSSSSRSSSSASSKSPRSSNDSSASSVKSNIETNQDKLERGSSVGLAISTA